MKNKIVGMLLVLIGITLFPFKVNAANSINVSANKTSVVKGSAVTITVKYYSSNFLSTGEGTLTYDKSILQYTGGDQLAIDFFIAENSITTKTLTYNFKAIKAGTSSVSVSGGRVLELAGGQSWQAPPVSGTSVKVTEQVVLPNKTYSSNNNLKELSVEGHALTPTFTKDTLEYSLEVENTVNKVKINATKEDSAATISGDGEKEVTEGNNKLEVKVTAENGNVKTYIINVTVKELSPINVKINDGDYTVIRKTDVLESPKDYEETKVTINGEEVLAYYSAITKFTLVGLKDKEGKANYYIYDTNKNTFILYNEFNFNKNTLYIMEFPSGKVPQEYNKVTITIDNKKVIAYKLTSTSDYYLIYAMNIDTGKEHIYVYDEIENTIQRYNEDELTQLRDLNEKYKYVIVGMAACVIIIILVLLISKVSGSKKKKKKAIKLAETKPSIDKPDTKNIKEEKPIIKSEEEIKIPSVDPKINDAKYQDTLIIKKESKNLQMLDMINAVDDKRVNKKKRK